jgi:hypothetical protein
MVPKSLVRATRKTTQQTPAPEKLTTGTLVVSMQQREARGEEGYVTFFLVNSSGSRVDEARLKSGASGSITLPPDSHYELVSYIRDCSENCIMGLSAPVDECRAPFTLKAGEKLYATRLADPDSRGCDGAVC